jgi:hypothetical protein
MMGEGQSPWAVPLKRLNKFPFSPLSKIMHAFLFVPIVRNQEINISPKLKNLKVLTMKVWSTESNAFAWSTQTIARYSSSTVL